MQKFPGTRSTPQSEPLPSQVPNSAGGHAWAVDDWVRLDRFLILGTEGGSYYASEQKLTAESAQAVARCIKADGARTVARIVEVSEAGRAPKNDPALYALAMALKTGDEATRRAAEAAAPKVARIGTHLFHLAEYVQGFGGWGRLTRRAFREWYRAKPADDLALQAIKYQFRDGWSHRDLLRLSHPKAPTPAHQRVYWHMLGLDPAADPPKGRRRHPVAVGVAEPRFIEGTKAIAGETDPKRAAKLIREYGLPRKAVPTGLLTHPSTWEALLPHMGYTAVIRNLANMTKCGLIAPLSKAAAVVATMLAEPVAVRRSRVHPLQVLAAMLTYSQGHGMRGKGQWAPVQPVVDALDAAFYASFGNVRPTGRPVLLALDVSGSMDTGTVGGVQGLTPRKAAAAMAMVTARVEPERHILAFSDRLVDFPVGRAARLDSVVARMDRMPFGGTDCALPMLWASERRAEVDGFVVYTDSETWAGKVHPSQALRKYRQGSGRAARLAVVGLVGNEFTIADPDDAGMMDFVGFDGGAPAVLADFLRA